MLMAWVICGSSNLLNPLVLAGCLSYLEELEAACEYIVNNLSKRFIRPSNALYTSPILMA